MYIHDSLLTAWSCDYPNSLLQRSLWNHFDIGCSNSSMADCGEGVNVWEFNGGL
jgi:hypothetical protein